MKNIERLRSMPIEEVARERVKYHSYPGTPIYYIGDFGYLKVVQNLNYRKTYAEAIRREIEWLNSEETKEEMVK